MLFDDKQYFTVSELNALVRTLIEENHPEVTVLGEVSNFKRHTSGHLYFTLKDSDAQLRTVCFRRDAGRVGFEPADGAKVLASGRLTLYEPYGQYQLVAYAIEKAGIGELEQAFRELREKLEKEGLFDPEHKKGLPPFPFKIAVVTSPTGAAVRDVLSTLRRRWPCAEVFVFPVRVQGERAAPEIVRALELLADVEGLDVIIVGRGGGSLEDLWAFNEESVARAIYHCPVPVISAVGHETDFTIADFVADVRAATPTMAAEIAVPDIEAVARRVTDTLQRFTRFMRTRLDMRKGRLQELLRSYALGRVRAQVERYQQAHDYTMEKLERLMTETIGSRRVAVNENMTRLEGLDARAILTRGYSICSERESGRIIRSAARALESREMRVTFGDGSVLSEVKEKLDERR